MVLYYIMHMENNSQYLSVDQAAAILGLSPQQIRNLIKQNIISAQKVGKTWIVNSNRLNDEEFVFHYQNDVKNQIRKTTYTPKHVALSFFSGAMGLDIGLSKAGLEIILASEIEPNARKTILLNKPDIGLIGDINDFTVNDIRKYANISDNTDIDLIVGGPPCQAFSTAGKREGFGDKRGNVFLTFVDRILELRPKYAVIENVRGLLSAPYEGIRKDGFGYSPKTPEDLKGSALLHIIKKLENGGYSVSFNLYNAANFGAPQKRERIVIICSRNGIKPPYLMPTNSEDGSYNLPKWRTLRDALTGLDSQHQDYLTFPDRRLKYYRMLKEGQCWKDLPPEYMTEAMGAKLSLGGGKTGFFRRLSWDKPSPTLVTDPTMPATDLCHPNLDRPLSVQEYKRIQEFPDDWKIFGNIKEQYRQIGNAVPISLGYAIGKEIIQLLDNEKPEEPPTGFPFSRYVNTDEVSFNKLMEKKLTKHSNSPQLYLF